MLCNGEKVDLCVGMLLFSEVIVDTVLRFVCLTFYSTNASLRSRRSWIEINENKVFECQNICQRNSK